MPKELNDMQRRFVEEYMLDLNATQAAIRALYSPKTAYSIGNRLLKNAEVRARIDILMAELSVRTGVNAERVIMELAKIAFINPMDCITDEAVVLKTASRADMAAIASIKFKRTTGEAVNGIEREVKFVDKTKALELLGKHLGIFKENVNITGDIGVMIVDDIPSTTAKS